MQISSQIITTNNQHPCEVYSSLVGYLIKIRVSIQKWGVRSINVIKFHYKNET